MVIDFKQIQGNIFGGFNKDHLMVILLKVTDSATARNTLTEGTPSIFDHVKNSTSEQVIAFNEKFRALRQSAVPEGTIVATWTNIVFTKSGLEAFGKDLSTFPKAFTDRMEKRSIGDVDENAPPHWNDGIDVSVDWPSVDVMILLASDEPTQLDMCARDSRLSVYLSRLDDTGSGFSRLGLIRGETRVDQIGHEHFGFKDGVSQPGIRGVDAPDDPLHNPDQGNPGQDLLHPGEFVLGYPTQIASAKVLPDGTVVDGPNPDEGPNSLGALPAWAANGSFLVFRRLAQDVQGFREVVAKMAASLGLTTDLLGAKLVGRYRSGAPLMPLTHQAGTDEHTPPLIDPGVANPAYGNNNAINNAFEYGDDVDGDIVPLAAHIRKAYPRDQVPFKDGAPSTELEKANAESFTQTHRLLRRGIPFGKSLNAPELGGGDDARGLLFLCYQSDLERQFEFVQNAWVNNADFPEKNAGQDPIITNSSAASPIKGCPFHLGADALQCPVSFRHFVRTRGGGYFFSPSINTLGELLAM